MLFFPHEKAQALVDYSMIILLIALLLIAGLMTFQASLSNLFCWIIVHWPSTPPQSCPI